MRDVTIALCVIATAALLSLLLRGILAPTNLAMIFLLGVIVIAVQCSRATAVVASFLSVAVFDFLFVPPYWTFVVEDSEYIVTFVGMLAVALIISGQTALLKQQRTDSEQRRVQSDALYRMTRMLSGETRAFDAARDAAAEAETVFGRPVVIFLLDAGKVSFRRRTMDTLTLPSSDEAAANRALDRTEPVATPFAHYFALRGAKQAFGVMAVLGPEQPPALAPLFAGQIGLVLERIHTQNQAEESRFEMQTEQLRSALLSAVSHDLRTPLSSITGAATTILEQGDKIEPAIRTSLLEDIASEAERLSRLVKNLLDMTRFQSGSVTLKRELCPLEDIVVAALDRCKKLLTGRPVNIHVPETVAPLHADELLLTQVLINLIENAVKYTPPDSPLYIEAEEGKGRLRLDVRDTGPGIPEGEATRIFEKFYRAGSRSSSRPTKGAGLGLAICKAIVEAHGGTIEALNNPGGGATFRIDLPAGAAA